MNTLKSLCLAVSLLCLPASAQATSSYAPASDYINISKALFKTGVLRANDPAAIDEYLRISQCGLFEQYGNNDIAWTRIRESQANDIASQIPTFNEKIEVIGYVTLGQYDAINGGFIPSPKDAFENLSFVNIVEIQSGSLDVCAGNKYWPFVPRVHPLRLRARLQDPFDLRLIPIDQDKADTLLRDLASRPLRYIGDQQRDATLVMRLTLGSADPLSSAASGNSTNIVATLDELLIYDGPERNKLLYRKDFKKKP